MSLRTAAVLVPVIEDGSGAASLVFIHRTHGGPHGGQIAFPGGVRENGDASPEETALREFEEEMGVSRDLVEVLERLPDVETRTTGYVVTPVIGRLAPPAAWSPDPGEVQEVITVPVRDLLRPESRGETEEMHPTWDAPRRFPCFIVGRHRVWGLTHRILEMTLPWLERRGGGAPGSGSPAG